MVVQFEHDATTSLFPYEVSPPLQAMAHLIAMMNGMNDVISCKVYGNVVLYISRPESTFSISRDLSTLDTSQVRLCPSFILLVESSVIAPRMHPRNQVVQVALGRGQSPC